MSLQNINVSENIEHLAEIISIYTQNKCRYHWNIFDSGPGSLCDLLEVSESQYQSILKCCDLVIKKNESMEKCVQKLVTQLQAMDVHCNYIPMRFKSPTSTRERLALISIGNSRIIKGSILTPSDQYNDGVLCILPEKIYM